MTAPDSSDRWTFCSLGHIHWGAVAEPGLLLRYVPAKGEPVYLLTERSRGVDEGRTWGMPGGAIHDAESAEEAAHREATEEICPVLGVLRDRDQGAGLRRRLEIPHYPRRRR